MSLVLHTYNGNKSADKELIAAECVGVQIDVPSDFQMGVTNKTPEFLMMNPIGEVKNIDWISKLPDDVLLMILSRLSTEEAIRTSVASKRWEHVWKQMSHLVFDMRRIINSRVLREGDGSHRVATLMTKVINNHRGHLESCVITHFSYQGENGMLNTWIQSLTCMKHTKNLTLHHYSEFMDRSCIPFDFSPYSFSHPSLTSLSLKIYTLKSSHPLRNCWNLRTLKLLLVVAPEVGVFNRVLASCPSLEVLVLNITCCKRGGPLKIENNKLKFLQVSYANCIDGIIVSATSLDILVIMDTCTLRKDDLILQAPKLQFNRNFWVAERFLPHISYNISKEEKSIGDEEFVNISGELLRPQISVSASFSVGVDVMNRTEVERLRQVLCLWTHKMQELEIKFKENNAPREENESWQKKLWEENNNKDPFPNAKFRVKTVWMYNFSGSEEEFALVSCLIRQGTVLEKMVFKSNSFPARKKLNIEAAVAKLQALQTEDQRKVTIECF